MKRKQPKDFDDLYREAETHDDYWIAGCVQDFTEELFKEMQRQGISRSELARRLGTSPAYVTKILRGNTSFTLATMVKLSRALDTELKFRLEPEKLQRRHAPKRPAAGSSQGEGHTLPMAASPADPNR